MRRNNTKKGYFKASLSASFLLLGWQSGMAKLTNIYTVGWFKERAIVGEQSNPRLDQDCHHFVPNFSLETALVLVSPVTKIMIDPVSDYVFSISFLAKPTH